MIIFVFYYWYYFLEFGYLLLISWCFLYKIFKQKGNTTFWEKRFIQSIAKKANCNFELINSFPHADAVSNIFSSWGDRVRQLLQLARICIEQKSLVLQEYKVLSGSISLEQPHRLGFTISKGHHLLLYIITQHYSI